MRRLLLRVLGAALVAGAAVWLAFFGRHLVALFEHRGQVPVASGEFLRPVLVDMAKTLFPAGALFGCGLWAFDAARRERRRRVRFR